MSIAMRRSGWSLVLLAGCASSVLAHDDKFEQDREPRYEGPGFRLADGGTPPLDFDSRSIELLSWIPIGEFDRESISANDCWGYTSPSGREYAIIGLHRGTGFVDITDPTNPRIVSTKLGDVSAWQDIKVYGHYAYSVTEAVPRIIGGIRVFDLERIDDVDGGVRYVRTVNTPGTTTATHNLAIDEVSGFLYRCGGGDDRFSGLRIYDLADPSEPAFVGSWNRRYVHDAQVVTYPDNHESYPGKQIALCFANDTAQGGSPGVDILDVTDKHRVGRVGSIDLAQEPILSHQAVFSHQGWLSPDWRYLYLGDEVDEDYPPFRTTTRVIDVSDLSNPVQVATFTNQGTARDHNLYTRDGLIFEANYRSGLRIFDARDPVSPVEIAHFDTYPPDDEPRYNGLWSVYAYFPSGTIIGSDIEKGLFVWRFRDCRDLTGSGPDCNQNNLFDSCDLDDGTSGDCNDNHIPDECDIANGLLSDANGDGLPDECCRSDRDCDNGIFCDGAETCVDSHCLPGGNPCPELKCDSKGRRCVECFSNGECDDGLYCTGAEACNGDGRCQDGPPPCPPGITCSEKREECDCAAEGDCDDGLFCNGQETCDFGTGQCVEGVSPCLMPDVCDERADACVECLVGADCTDGDPCTADRCPLGQCTHPPIPGCNDRDLDGVIDDLDDCPGTVRGAHVDARGCSCAQLDDDNDGVDNCRDDCAATPADESPDMRGCSDSQVAPKPPAQPVNRPDRDNDGVPDELDLCAGTQFEVAAQVDADGCSPRQLQDTETGQQVPDDGDASAIPDAEDGCGSAAEGDGCALDGADGRDQASRRTSTPCGFFDLLILAGACLGLGVMRAFRERYRL